MVILKIFKIQILFLKLRNYKKKSLIWKIGLQEVKHTKNFNSHSWRDSELEDRFETITENAATTDIENIS